MAENLYISEKEVGGEGAVLPPGTYVPKNSVSGAFDLLWKDQTNVDTDLSTIKKIASASTWDGSSYFNLQHESDFELQFKIDFSEGGDNVMFGVDYYKASNSYEHIDFCFYRSGINSTVFEAGAPVFSYGSSVDDSTVYAIERSGYTMNYKINGTTIRSVTIDNKGTVNIDCSIREIDASVVEIQVTIP